MSFLNLMSSANPLGLLQMHIFKYSIREGTARLKNCLNRIRGEIKEERSRKMN